MHELGIAQGILDRARDAAQANGAFRVTDLFVTITAAADFTEDSLAMYVEMLTCEEALFRDVRLHVEHAPARAHCLGCGEEFLASARDDGCPRCCRAMVRFDAQAPMVQLTDISIDEGSMEEGGGA